MELDEGDRGTKPRHVAEDTRYYLGEGDQKGPYTVDQLLASALDGAISRATMVHAEGESELRPLGQVLDEQPDAPPAPRARKNWPPQRRPGTDRSASPRRAIDLDNAYAPPGVEEEPSPPSFDGIPDTEGNYWLGFAAGFFGGCIALIFSSKAKPQTKRGIHMGFMVGIAVGILRVVVEASMKP